MEDKLLKDLREHFLIIQANCTNYISPFYTLMGSFRELQPGPEAELLFRKPVLPFPLYACSRACSLSALFQFLLIHHTYCCVVPQLVTETSLGNWQHTNRFLTIRYEESFEQEGPWHSRCQRCFIPGHLYSFWVNTVLNLASLK